MRHWNVWWGSNRAVGLRNWLPRCLSLLLTAVALGFLTFPTHAFGAEGDDGCFVNFQVENDLFGGRGKDNHYSQGMRLSFLIPNSQVQPGFNCFPFDEDVRGLGRRVDELIEKIPFIAERNRRVSFVLGHNIYTPENIADTGLVLDDRPYAGWLYAGLGLVTIREKNNLKVLDNFELDIGIVGKSSFAEQAQNIWHREVIHVPEANGWDNQLKSEVGVLALYERKWPYMFERKISGLELETTGSLGGAFGNVYTYGAAGVGLRVGQNLGLDYGPPRIRPGLHGGGFFRLPEGEKFSWYLFGGVEGRAVARNIFLDGNTFRNSHSVDKKTFVGDLQVGFVVTYQRFRLAFTNVFRSKEFDGQDDIDQFGSINLSYRIGGN